jgi:hypothetical protein
MDGIQPYVKNVLKVNNKNGEQDTCLDWKNAYHYYFDWYFDWWITKIGNQFLIKEKKWSNKLFI